MSPIKNQPRVCPILTLMSILGQRWTLMIFYTLSEGRHGFNDIKRSITGISARILSERLTQLEYEGFIRRDIVSERPVKVSYELTEQGKLLNHEIANLNAWGITHKEFLLKRA